MSTRRSTGPTYTGCLPRHFLTGSELTRTELSELLDRALELKRAPHSSDALERRTVALIFQRPSTRTRTSFEAGIVELGGHPMVLRTEDLQLSRGESLRDTAYALSRHVVAIGIRTGPDELVRELAEHASVPVVNMLTAGHHPCQALADLMTLKEAFGRLEGLAVAYVGDGNNVARSLAILGTTAGVQVRIASPNGYSLTESPCEPASGSDIVSAPGSQAPAGVRLTHDPLEAVAGADAIYTDVWVSMNDDPDTAAQRIRALAPYRVDDELLDRGARHAFALHCLPAHPGEEITPEVLYGARQRIWEQAENRRHAHKALLEFITSGQGEGP